MHTAYTPQTHTGASTQRPLLYRRNTHRPKRTPRTDNTPSKHTRELVHKGHVRTSKTRGGASAHLALITHFLPKQEQWPYRQILHWNYDTTAGFLGKILDVSHCHYVWVWAVCQRQCHPIHHRNFILLSTLINTNPVQWWYYLQSVKQRETAENIHHWLRRNQIYCTGSNIFHLNGVKFDL